MTSGRQARGLPAEASSFLSAQTAGRWPGEASRGRELPARGVSRRDRSGSPVTDRAVEKPREEEAALTGARVRGESSQAVGAASAPAPRPSSPSRLPVAVAPAARDERLLAACAAGGVLLFSADSVRWKPVSCSGNCSIRVRELGRPWPTPQGHRGAKDSSGDLCGAALPCPSAQSPSPHHPGPEQQA